MSVIDPTGVSAYFDALYQALADSLTHARIGREALGDGFVGQLGCADEEDLIRLAELAGMGAGRSVLDLCCGAGGTTVWFSQRTGSVVTGLDCSRVGLELGQGAARAAPTIDVNFVQGDVGRLPFGHGAFDAVVCLDGFGALFSEVFQECHRVLRPGGGLAFLLNLPQTPEIDADSEMKLAGFTEVHYQVTSEQSALTMRRWLAAYRKHARAHIAEVGRQYHRALTGELSSLLSQFKKGAVERLLITGVKGA